MKHYLLANRDATIIARFKGGDTMAAVGKTYKLTRERVRQILALNGYVRTDGGHSLKSTNKRMDRIAAWRNRWLPNYKCHRFEYDSIMKGLKYKVTSSNLANVYTQQKLNCKRHNIPFELSFVYWHNVWVLSGHLKDRGLAKGKYLMARINKKGPYQIGNLEIITLEKNSANTQTKEYCKRGHLLSDPNLIYYSRKAGGKKMRACKACSKYVQTKAYRMERGLKV